MQPELPRGAQLVMRGQVATMQSAYQQLFIGIAFAIVLIYLLDRRQFSVVARSPRDRAGAADGARRDRLDAVPHQHDVVGSGADRRDHVHGRRHREFDSGDQLRARAARGWAKRVPAALLAGATRFRPVIMTALAMIIGMAPMAIEPGQNAPLGRAVIGGLIFATFATLFFVPALFSLIHARAHAPVSAQSAQALTPAE